jgi:holo-[acyl-carrier protein] synthase
MAIVGIGVDLVDIDRAERLLARHGERALRRLLFPAERAYVEGMVTPARHFAVRLAAKEAVYKALQTLPGAAGVGWRDIEVLRATSGRPGIQLHGNAARVVAHLGPHRIHVTLTHTERTAGAFAVVERTGADGSGRE